MDPFSALDLASNIAQFLDFGGRLITGSIALYKSMDGVFSANGELQNITDDLNSLCRALTDPQKRIDIFDNESATASERALIPLSQSCEALSREFLSVLGPLNVNTRHKRFDSLRQALRSELKKGQIQDYQKRLEAFRSQITLHLMEILR